MQPIALLDRPYFSDNWDYHWTLAEQRCCPAAQQTTQPQAQKHVFLALMVDCAATCQLWKRLHPTSDMCYSTWFSFWKTTPLHRVYFCNSLLSSFVFKFCLITAGLLLASHINSSRRFRTFFCACGRSSFGTIALFHIVPNLVLNLLKQHIFAPCFGSFALFPCHQFFRHFRTFPPRRFRTFFLCVWAPAVSHFFFVRVGAQFSAPSHFSI